MAGTRQDEHEPRKQGKCVKVHIVEKTKADLVLLLELLGVDCMR